MSDREDLIEMLKREPEPAAKDVAALISAGSVGSQLLGLLLRQNAEMGTSLQSMDLISDEGRLRTIQYQGRLAGRAELTDVVLDLILQGSEELKDA